MNKIIRLGDICDFINGGAWSDKEYVADGIPVLKVSNFKPSGFLLKEASRLPNSSLEKYKKNLLQTGDMVIATVGSHPNLINSAAGRVCTITDEVSGYLLNQNAVCVRGLDPEVLDQRYLTYLGRSFYFQHYIQSRGRGAANQMRIAISAIKDYKFELLDIVTQRRIAHILSAYDNLIENNQKQIKLLEEAAMRLYKEWFVNLRFPGYENTHIVDGVPEGWELQCFNKVFTFTRGKSYTSKELSDKEGVLLINLKNIRAFGGYNRSVEKKFTGAYKENQTVKSSDVIMAVTDMTQERRLVGYVGLVPNLKAIALITMDLVKLIPYEVSNYYLYSTLRFSNFGKVISQYANGVNVLHLKADAIMDLEMLTPPKSILGKFDEIAKSFFQKIDILENQIDEATQARDKLLPKLMSGEIVV